MRYLLIFVFILFSFNSAYTNGGSPKPVGLGFIIGEPSGFHAKFRLSNRNDIDAMLGFDFDEWIFLHADYLWNFPISSSADLGVYVGPGAFIASHTGDHYSDEHHHDTRFGPQGVFGLRIILGNQFDIFGEAQLRMNIIDDTDINVHGGLGAHIFF